MANVRLDADEALASVGGLEICWQAFGPSDAAPLLLIAGLNAQMIFWEDDFCRALAERGFRVIRFDNRDIGKSSRIDWTPPVDARKALSERASGEAVAAPYLLKDMAGDAVGLLDALGIARAHIVGASMGGRIAQEVALGWPERVRSLTSIMSSTGERSATPPSAAVMEIFTAPPPANADEYIEANIRAWRAFRGADYPEDEARDRPRAIRAAARGFSIEGEQRQSLANYASGSRRTALARVAAPTLVIHGADDPIAPLALGEGTAAAIPGARLVVLDRMGHALPLATWPRVIDEIAAITRGVR